MNKPRITHRRTTDTSVFEFSNGQRTASALQGGLIDLRADDRDGSLRVDLYRLDPKVIVTVSGEPDNAYASALQTVTRTMLAVRSENPDATEADFLRAVLRMNV
jgi:hypothetical protein